MTELYEVTGIFALSVTIGFSISVFAGFLSWGITAVCRLFKQIISSGR